MKNATVIQCEVISFLYYLSRYFFGTQKWGLGHFETLRPKRTNLGTIKFNLGAHIMGTSSNFGIIHTVKNPQKSFLGS